MNDTTKPARRTAARNETPENWTDEERAAIVDRWDVDLVVVDRGDPTSGSVEAWLLHAGATALDQRDDWSVWRTGS